MQPRLLQVSQRKKAVFFSAVLLTIVLITGLMRYFFHDSPPPSFADLYLVAVLVLGYRHSWKAAAALAGVSLLLCAYLLVPLNGVDRLELGSFGVCAALVVYVTANLHRRRANRATTQELCIAVNSVSEGICPDTEPKSIPVPQS